MSWFRLDDEMPTHPKIGEAGGDAAWLWVCAGCWCAKWGTNGRIPKHQIPRLTDRKSPMKLAERLVRAGLLEESGDYFVVHDYLDFNPSSDEVAARRAQRSEAGKAGGQKSGEARRKRAVKQTRSGSLSEPPSESEAGDEPRTPVSEPKGSERKGYTKAERDPIFAVLCDLFGEPKTRTTKTFYGKSVTELLDAGANADEVRRRGEVLKRKGWNDVTAAALCKHWHSLGTPTRPGRNFDVVSS